jgi:hypothetical protein
MAGVDGFSPSAPVFRTGFDHPRNNSHSGATASLTGNEADLDVSEIDRHLRRYVASRRKGR